MSIEAYVNGKIYVSFKPPKAVDGFIVYNGRIVYVGGEKETIDLAKKLNANIIDLNGRVVLPGFIDSHVHLDGLGKSLKTLDLRDVRSISELKERVRRYYESNPDMSWIIGRGWDQELFKEGRWPNRWDIDEVVDDKPVMLIRVCGHAAVVNTKALEVAGLLDKQVDSKNYVKDEEGNLNGIILEDAVSHFNSLVKHSEDELEDFLLKAMKHAISNGVTTVGFMGCSLKVFKILERLRRENKLPLRVRCYFKPDEFNKILDLGLRVGYGNEYLKIMGVKLFADGSLGARTAWLSEPYTDDPGNKGKQLIKIDELRDIIKRVDDAGLQVAVHAIGDEAIDMVIKVYSMLGEDVKRYRHRIEHLSVVRIDQIRKLAELGISVSMQPHFIITDWWALKRLGIERAKNLYPFKTLINNGVILGFSTDSPVEPLNPWETVYAAVTRGVYEDIELSKYTGNEKLNVEEAIHHYTIMSAYLLHDDGLTGSLEIGRAADFIIIDKDPLRLEGKILKDIKILATYVNGQRVYKK